MLPTNQEIVQQVFRLTQKERATLETVAKKADLSIGSIVRQMLTLDEDKYGSTAGLIGDLIHKPSRNGDHKLMSVGFRLTQQERDKLSRMAEGDDYASVSALIRDRLKLPPIKGSGRPPMQRRCPRCKAPCESAAKAKRHCVVRMVPQYQPREE